MKKVFVILIVGVFAVVSNLYAQPLARKIPMSWTQETIRWKKSDWEYFLGEDKDYVYVGLLLPESRELKQVLITGLTVWLGKKEGHKKSLGVRFPLGLPIDERPSTPQELRSILFDWTAREEAILKSFTSMEVINVNGNMDTLLGPADRVGGFRSSLVYEADYWILELIIPKNLVPKDVKELKKKGVFLESGTLSRPRNLRGTDAVGISNSSIYGPNYTTKSDKERLDTFFYYGDFTVPIRQKIKGVGFDFGNN
ncbi:MAG: hypothetical protein AAFY71_26110 [Bacteroidota bacterium]